MGALTELCDSYDNLQGYKIARNIFKSNGPGLSTDQIRSQVWNKSKWERFGDEILLWYYRLSGADYSYFFHYKSVFGDHPEWISTFKETIRRDKNLDFIERMSCDDDFFIFRPREHSLGLELIVHNGLCPTDLNKRFAGCTVIDYDYVDGYGAPRFRW